MKPYSDACARRKHLRIPDRLRIFIKKPIWAMGIESFPVKSERVRFALHRQHYPVRRLVNCFLEARPTHNFRNVPYRIVV